MVAASAAQSAANVVQAGTKDITAKVIWFASMLLMVRLFSWFICYVVCVCIKKDVCLCVSNLSHLANP